jgi:hypothetical protein
MVPCAAWLGHNRHLPAAAAACLPPGACAEAFAALPFAPALLCFLPEVGGDT